MRTKVIIILEYMYMPISACGLRLDNEAVRIAVGLRLGVDLCTTHDCPCGKTADARGIYSWSFLPFGLRKDGTPPRGQRPSLASSM